MHFLGFSENFLTFVTGCLIFYPMCFVSNPVHAIIMGVTMHYTQYLYLTYLTLDHLWHLVCYLLSNLKENPLFF